MPHHLVKILCGALPHGLEVAGPLVPPPDVAVHVVGPVHVLGHVQQLYNQQRHVYRVVEKDLEGLCLEIFMK